MLSSMLRNSVKRNLAASAAHSRFASTLVIAEQSGSSLGDGTRSAVTAASKLSEGDIHVLVVGGNAGAIAEQASKVSGVSKVVTASDAAYDHAVAENMSSLIQKLQESNSYTHIIAPANNSTKNYLPRVAAALDQAPLTDVLDVVDDNTFVRPMYAGNAIAKVQTSGDGVTIFTIRSTGFEKADAEGGSAGVEEVSDAPGDVGMTSFVKEEVSASDRPELTSARVVVSGGRGLKSGENFEMLDKLADKLGGAVGASRAAVDAGFVPNEYQVGQTGKVVAPDLYIAAGISGAIQHLAGMKDSKTIVAINKDEEAPIFQVADYGLVDDLFKTVPELTEKI